MERVTAIMAGLCLMIPGVIGAQSGNPNSNTKLISGSVRSFDGSTTLVVRSEVNGTNQTTTILLNDKTEKTGELARGNDVTVQYRVEGDQNIAIMVQAQAPELETLEYAKSTISLDGEATAHITSGNNVAVEGSGSNHDKFQHDVILTATLWDADGKAVGTATGRLEDLPAGKHANYHLTGTVTATKWARVSVVISNVTEHVKREQ